METKTFDASRLTPGDHWQEGIRIRDGRRVKITTIDGESPWPVQGIIEGQYEVSAWRLNGGFWFGTHPWDLVMCDKDSNQPTPSTGETRTFSTGSIRDSRKGKGRFDLIPPEAIIALAKHLEKGAEKYGDRNWEKGQPMSAVLDSGERHLNAYKLGAKDEDHLVAAFCNLAFAITIRERINNGKLPKDLDDMPGGL